MSLSDDITDATSFLGKRVSIEIDRPLHSRHPKHGFIYECNYGFVPDTKSLDGEELDAYVLGVHQPLQRFDGICVAVIHRLNDDDDKLVVMPEGETDISDEEIAAVTHFQEQFFESRIIRPA